MKNFTALFAVVGFAALMGGNAEAATPTDVPTETVRYTNPGAADTHAVAALYDRINAAAGRVCGQRLAPGSAFVSRPWRQCVHSAMRAALGTINAPAVTNYAAAQGVVGYDSAIARRN
ncbi:MAG TPA: UrcA family protein [Steroidobacteraceae bacterium]|nr:UrcA family protein [Steroidobacteraceae bacterium]